MKKKLLSTGFFVMLLLATGFSQSGANTAMSRKLKQLPGTPTLSFTTPDMKAIHAEDEERDRNGEAYRFGVQTFTNITTQNAGSWTTNSEGDRVWQLHVHFPGAEALSFMFDKFHLYDQASIDVFDNAGNRLHRTYTAEDVLDHGMQNMSLCFGDEMTIQITEPEGTRATEIHMDRVMYCYRATGNPNVAKINESESCEVNVNCTPVGDPWQDEKRGVARIMVVDNGTFWCTGSLVNNTAQDCKPLFLTALHCGVNTSAANSNQWRFYFRYETPTCANVASAGTLDDHFITGCVRLSNSADGGGDSGSDFLLVQLGSLANEASTITTLKSANFNAYWNGWDANNTATTGGTGIHHPAGDVKKISTFSGSTVSSGWNGNGLQSHWRLSWTANSNGHGVTEGGSSGSPIFKNSNGRIIGTLTGGSSFCNTPTSPDYYGKMSYHWTSNGSPANEQLKTHLDPGNTGLLVLDGSSDPCTPVSPTAPVADFVASATNVTVGTTVTFTDLTTNAPTSWSWTITPASGWAYAGGTNASSQNPQVTFNTAGQYTVALTATNAIGSDTETKTNYITVTASSGPCSATSTDCDEFIQNVTLGSINNTTGCSNYANYSANATLSQNTQYTVTVVPQITGQQVGTAYTNDEIAVWIDFNDDMDFSDAGEQVGYVLVPSQGTFNTAFQFTVPAGATIGQTTMRVRMSYLTDDGPINPCGTTTYGEVEDYVITIQQAQSNSLEESIFANVNVYPNPTSNTLNIDLSEISEDVTVALVDMTGKVLAVKANVAGQIATFDMSNYAKGMYQVRFTNGSVVNMRKVTKL